jgi:hypothetical protein
VQVVVPSVVEPWAAMARTNPGGPTVHTAPTISIVVPALNEAANLPHVLPRIPVDVFEVILVDGHSTDDTVAVARELLPGIRVVEQEGRGKGAALRTGFAAARGDIIVMLDADGSTAPEEIPSFVRALIDGADMAKGSRFMTGGGTSDMPAYRKLGNFGFVVAVRTLFGGRYTDLCYGYMAFWKRIVPLLALDLQVGRCLTADGYGECQHHRGDEGDDGQSKGYGHGQANSAAEREGSPRQASGSPAAATGRQGTRSPTWYEVST